MRKVDVAILEIFEDEIVPLCEQAFKSVARKIQMDLKRAGLVNSSQLMDSVWTEKAEIRGNLEFHLRIGMKGYGRFKDMARVTYDNFMPEPNGEFVSAIEDWIERGGIRRQKKYIPGYYTDAKRRVVVPESRALNRLAYTIALGIVRRNENKRNARFWNRNRGAVYGTVREMIYDKLPTETLNLLKAYYEKYETDAE
ncbi:MAG: hypothetical protein ACK4UP_05180 [Spirosomataceae bacterium]